MQDPHFTDLDTSFLQSLGYEVAKDPEAFAQINTRSLVYAIHCETPIYMKIQEIAQPALLIGNNLQEKLALSNDASYYGLDGTTGELLLDGKTREHRQTLSLTEGCEEVPFPQLDTHFSDTMIYWRYSPVYETG